MPNSKKDLVTSRYLVQPDLLPGLDMIPPLSLDAESLGQMRDLAKQFSSLSMQSPLSPELTREEVFVPGCSGAPDIRILLYTPTAATRPCPALLYIHGGGYIMGSPEMNDVTNRQLAETLGCVIAAVDYRLAPEWIYPAAIEDCYAVLQWLHLHSQRLGVDIQRIAVAGQSAGGGLAAALCLMARDVGEIPICLQLLTAPMIDDRTGAEHAVPSHIGEFVWTKELNQFGWRSLLGRESGGLDTPSYAAAARAENLQGLPPTFIYVGSLDLFVEENIDYARRLIAAAVPTELHIYNGAYHGFEMVPTSETSQSAKHDLTAALRRAFENLNTNSNYNGDLA